MGGGGKSGGGGGGKKGGSGGGSTPDFYNAARMTSESSRPNISGPMGSQTWTKDAQGRDVLTQNSNYQGAFNALQGATQNAASLDPSKARDQAINQNMDFGMSRLNPMFDQQNKAFGSSMANMGLQPGEEAYNEANRQLRVGQNDAFNSMYTNALNMGNQTQQTQQAQQLLPYQQLGMLSGATGVNNPNLGQGADYNRAAENQQSVNQAQQGQGKGIGNLLGTAGSIAGTVFGGPIGTALGGAAGNMAGGLLGGSGTNGSGKKGATEPRDFTPGGAYEGWT